MKLSEKIKALPQRPGVYIIKDKSGAVIYVGKAVSLKKRVASYFGRTSRSVKEQLLLKHAAVIETVLTASGAEALILEAGLIKEYRPKYNVAVRDDKSYPLLKVTLNERFPRLLIVRRRKKDGARYFGPYTSGLLLREAVKFLRHIFPLRTCKTMPASLCLNYHLQQCPGPCAGKIASAQYRKNVSGLLLFLAGKKSALTRRLSREMHRHSQAQNFEKALELRGQISALGLFGAPGKRFPVLQPLQELKTVLCLKRTPDVIEGFDVSDLFGREASGSMVRFKNGTADKSGYRRFRIKMTAGINDYAMITEVIMRRYAGSLGGKMPLPDLILIDGGKGHLQAAQLALKEAGCSLPVISIAKKFEHIYVPWQSEPLALPRDSRALHLIMRVRDEAHRFALSYHTSLRKKEFLMSGLDQIPGIGNKRRKIIMKNIDAISRRKRLTIRGLTAIEGIDERTAKNIIAGWKKY